MRWTKLNLNFDADPNAPESRAVVSGSNVMLRFFLNRFIWDDVKEGHEGLLAFSDVLMYRLGPTNDEGFYMGQCRFSHSGISWGDFYELQDSDWQHSFPGDRVIVSPAMAADPAMKHYLFYFKDATFECIAKGFEFRRVGTDD